MDGVITNHQIIPAAFFALDANDHGKRSDRPYEPTGFQRLSLPGLAGGRPGALLLLKYALLGIVPLIVPSILIDIPIPTNTIQAQRGTDLAYIKALASRVGYVFYLEPGPTPGLNKAYWGPQNKLGVPQPSLNLNMDAHSNVEQLSFKFDNTKNEEKRFRQSFHLQ